MDNVIVEVRGSKVSRFRGLEVSEKREIHDQKTESEDDDRLATGFYFLERQPGQLKDMPCNMFWFARSSIA
jgi:hypothetical protein